MPSFSLEGRSAVVTGAGRGIGRAIAETFAQAGAEVWLCARTGAEIEEAASAIRDAGYKAEALAIDVTDIAGFRAAIDGIGCLDVFVNNAGTNRPKPLIEVEKDDYDAVADLNARAAFFALQSAARRMIALGTGGSIISMSSQMGHVGAPNRSLYCATKWGLEGLTKAASMELAPHGIRVNTICPTFIETPLTRPYFTDPAFREETLNKIRLGRLGQVEDITGAALFLASDASSLMTGSAVLVDGGWTAG
ncbi:SDR family NAD(P)-dependent oxidoreductase [Aureimonas mangrovi]|uniref:SDR family NAD(P)-dependent oxidoreductase n=1 Tax=Aureimonas mangrovi TaxID=2758041 RepID=UPI001FE8DE3D|nr:SDR family NAD(P)-dependent oxidoreductase [Aureimonas mangrovi]